MALVSPLHDLLFLSMFFSLTILLFNLLSLTFFFFAAVSLHVSFEPFTLPQILKGKRSKSSFIYNNGVVSYKSILTLRLKCLSLIVVSAVWLQADVVTSLTVLMIPWSMEASSLGNIALHGS